MTSRKKWIATIAAGALIGIAGATLVGFKLIQARKAHEPPMHAAQTLDLPSGDKEFNSEHVGISFAFPTGYSAEFSHENDGVEAWHAVTVQKAGTDSKPPPEGQPQVVVRIFETDGSMQAGEWAKSSKHAAPGGATATMGTLGADPIASYTDTNGVRHAVVSHDKLIYYYSYPAGDPVVAAIFEKMTASVGYPRDAQKETRAANWLNGGTQKQ